MGDVVWLWSVDQNIVVLVDASLDVDLAGQLLVLQAEQCCVDMKLDHVDTSYASLEVVNAEKMLLLVEADGVGGPECVLAVI